MKKIYVITLTFCIGIIANLLFRQAGAQGVWIQKSNFGGIARYGAVGFSIGSKGCIGTGHDGVNYEKDFWAWDQVTGAWTQMADFAGTARGWATGFSIGTKGYIGTGQDAVSHKQDLWEWDGDISSSTYNTWIQKLDFGGISRRFAVGFSIGTKGYIGTGHDGINYKKDFWEWDQTTNTWVQKLDFGGTARYGAVSFSIGTKGYIGTGLDANNLYADFWEWDQSTDTWVQKINFSGTARAAAVGFSIGTKGYIGTGLGSGGTTHQDFWEWDQVSNTWTQKANFARWAATGFSIGTKGYIGTGQDGINYKQDFWEYASNGVTSVSESDLETYVSVFPNPFSIQTTFNLSKEIHNGVLIIYNLSGKEASNINFSGKQVIIERQNLSSGTYFYKIISEDKKLINGSQVILTGKIIVQ